MNPSRYTTISSGLAGYINFTALWDGYISDFFADLRTGLGATGTGTALGTSLGALFAGFFADLHLRAGIHPSGHYTGNYADFFALTFTSFGGAGSICIYVYLYV